ncbi:heterokaryon incompatibility protein-domain-containing protein [Xylariomycetidae sp. FL2044]|nr:heterokaryon incompatibility protein-domain-containing protein [Xylariomycetidae sp. FL2044]
MRAAFRRTNPYTYEAIGGGEIRLITLHAGDSRAIVRISISRHAIETSPSLDYSAVSYVWGKPRLDRSIQCNDAELRVTSNVYDLLQQVRRPDGPIRLWIDAICINQKDLPERCHQVTLMKFIYSNASQVIIWTGKHDRNTLPVFSWFKAIAEEEEGFLSNFEKGTLRHIAAFTDRPWFHRAWTFQELCLARDAKMLCGHHELHWGIIAKALAVLESHGLLQQVLGSIADCLTASSRLYSKTANLEESSLSTILPLTRKLEASDPRDKVYAMLGLVNLSRLPGVKPDYTLSISEVYIAAARAMILEEQGLAVFSSATSRPITQDLPSWVPDWRVPRRTAYLHGYDWPATTSFYEINRHSPLKSLIKYGTGAELLLEGACLSTVTVVRDGCDLLRVISRELLSSSDPVRAWNKTLPRFNDLIVSMALPSIYAQTGESSRLALLRTLTADHMPQPKMIQEFVTVTMGRVQASAEHPQSWIAPELKSYLEHPKFQQYQASVEAGGGPAGDIDTFFFLCQMALNVLNYKLPKPAFSFFGTPEQKVFGHKLGYGIVEYIASMMQTFLRNRAVFKTSNGLIGLGPDSMAAGDQAWNLLGGSVPFILRTSGDSPRNAFRLVGECYIHGIMNGEMWSTIDPEKSDVTNGRRLQFEEITLI